MAVDGGRLASEFEVMWGKKTGRQGLDWSLLDKSYLVEGLKHIQ